MLSDFLEIGQGRGDLADHGAHPSQSGSLEGFASVEGVGVFDKFEVVPTHVFDHALGGLDVPECQFVMVLVIENVEEVSIEGVDVFYLGEVVEDVSEAFDDCLLAEFDLGEEGGTLRM